MVQLSLGCAQFGMNYGYTNKIGKINHEEVGKIIDFAIENNINTFDTAQSYGDSEEVLGKFIAKYSSVKISTKFESAQKERFSEKDIVVWENNFQNSLNKLRVNKIDSFLIHDIKDLKTNGSEILENWLQSLYKRKLINRLGISIYSSSDLNAISLKNIKLIQMPISLYDQRLINDKTCENLKKFNIAIHARSIFFQGLLLVKDNKWPSTISKDFKNQHNKNLKSLKTESLLLKALSFIENCSFIENALVGVTSLKELQEIVEIKNQLKGTNEDFSKFSWHQNNDLDPRMWNKN